MDDMYPTKPHYIREMRRGIPMVGQLTPEELQAAKIVMGKLGRVLGDPQSIFHETQAYLKQNGGKFKGDAYEAFNSLLYKRIGHEVGKTAIENKRDLALELINGITTLRSSLYRNVYDKEFFESAKGVDGEEYLKRCPFMMSAKNWRNSLNTAFPPKSPGLK